MRLCMASMLAAMPMYLVSHSLLFAHEAGSLGSPGCGCCAWWL